MTNRYELSPAERNALEAFEVDYNEHEVIVILALCQFLGIPIATLTRPTANHWLKTFYNLPHADRGDMDQAIAPILLATRMLSVPLRSEIESLLRRKGANYERRVRKAILGNPESEDYYEREGAQGILNRLLDLVGGAK